MYVLVHFDIRHTITPDKFRDIATLRGGFVKKVKIQGENQELPWNVIALPLSVGGGADAYSFASGAGQVACKTAEVIARAMNVELGYTFFSIVPESAGWSPADHE